MTNKPLQLINSYCFAKPKYFRALFLIPSIVGVSVVPFR